MTRAERLKKRALLFADHSRTTKDKGLFIYGKKKNPYESRYKTVYTFLPLYWLTEEDESGDYSYDAYHQILGSLLTFIHERKMFENDWRAKP